MSDHGRAEEYGKGRSAPAGSPEPHSRVVGPAGAGAANHPIWWSDAPHDPWRNPTTPTEVVLPVPPSHPAIPPLEPVSAPEPAPGRPRLLPVVLLTALVTGLVAGGLGGTLGYRFAAANPVGTVLGADPVNEPAAQAQRPPDSLAGVAARLLPSVVTVRATGRQGTNVGSGFLITHEGHVLTNDHVVGASSSPPVVTFHDGETATAELVGREPESDLAVLRVDRPGLRPVSLGDSDQVAVGDPVLAFGSPLSLANTVTSGIVSAVDRPIQAGDPGGQVRYYAAIQTDAAVNQGNSGGPLVDAAGRVIGVNSVIKSVAPQAEQAANIGLAFAIPISQAKRIAQEIIDQGKARRTVVGVQVDRTDRSSSPGVRVVAVVEGSPAAKSGIEPGDVLLRLNGQLLEQPYDLTALVRKHPPGAKVKLTYRRGGEERSVTVTLAADRD
ncbi:MAG TPA: trypsin-like peptidase domain-containing protein [Natronosporangium sp.]|nr:trypsin-like peptidase domain-containing protein [Natronosporangium sp.]